MSRSGNCNQFIYSSLLTLHVSDDIVVGMWAPSAAVARTPRWVLHFSNLFFLGGVFVPTVQYITVQYTTLLYSTLHYITVHYSTVQYSTIHYSTVQYSAADFTAFRYLIDLHDGMR